MLEADQRYLRHSLIDWFDQAALKKSSIAIIGCGAVGNEVAKNLALLGIGQLALFDLDHIEIHNLTRSVLFRDGDIGQSKAEVAASRLSDLDPGLTVSAYHGDFWETLTLDLLKKIDCVVCCVDNFEARIRINTLCSLAMVNLVNTGIDSKFAQAEVYPFAISRRVACFECNLPLSAYERIQERYSCGWLKKISYVEKKVPTTIITSSISGALGVSLCLNLLRDDGISESKRIFQDSFTGISTISILDRNPECPGCSSISDRVTILKGRADVQDIDLAAGGGDVRIVTSDPLVVSAHCVKCSTPSMDGRMPFRRAADFSSADMRCVACGSDSVEFDIRDTFSVTELIECFGGQVLPVKFLRAELSDKTLVIDLEKNYGGN